MATAVAAGLANTATLLGAVSAARAVAIDAGYIRAVALSLTIAAAGASITAKVYVNGVDSGAAVTIDAGASGATAKFSAGAYPVSAGDTIDVRLSTGALWSAITAAAIARIQLVAS